MTLDVRVPGAVRDACVAALCLLAWSCGGGGSSTKPDPIPDTPPNAAPAIMSLEADRQRIEVETDLRLSAAVTDAETPVTGLTYEWNAPVGSFTGTGPEVTWRAPAAASTPAPYELTLTVVEPYTAVIGGVRQSRENRTSRAVTVRLNHSRREAAELALRFLNSFADSSVSPEACVSEFTDTCRGKQSELSDVRHNRETFRILRSNLGTPVVRLNTQLTSAEIDVPCQFTSRRLATGATEVATGTCALTAVYQQWRWWLCESRFRGGTTSGLPFVL